MGRCNCKFRVSFGCPCAHELACDLQFKITEYSIRWLCPNEFDKIHPHLRPFKVQSNQLYCNIPRLSIPEEDMDNDNSQQSIHVDELDNVHLSELTQHCTACEATTSDYSKSHVSFTDLINAANQLVQTVTNEKKWLRQFTVP